MREGLPTPGRCSVPSGPPRRPPLPNRGADAPLREGPKNEGSRPESGASPTTVPSILSLVLLLLASSG